MEQRVVRTVMRPLKSKNITLAQAKRAWLAVMREEREAAERGRRQQRAGGHGGERPRAEA